MINLKGDAGMKRMTLMIIALFSFVITNLTACTFQITKEIVQELQPVTLYESYGTTPINLKAQSKCFLPPSINIVSMETRDEDYLVLAGQTKFYINPKEFMNAVVTYMKDGFEKSGIKVDNYSPKMIHVSMIDAKYVASGLGYIDSHLQLKVNIPETKFAKIFQAKDLSPRKVGSAMAYAVHVITQKIVADPEIHNYILCN
jgi:hypothetical protein